MLPGFEHIARTLVLHVLVKGLRRTTTTKKQKQTKLDFIKSTLLTKTRRHCGTALSRCWLRRGRGGVVRRGLIGLITSGFPLRLHVQFRLHVFSPYSFPFDTTTSVRHGSNNTHHVSMLPSRRPWSSIVPAALVFLLSLVLSLFVGWILENPV